MISGESRYCPNCKAVYKSKSITICLKCGHPTEKKLVTKGANREDSMGK